MEQGEAATQQQTGLSSLSLEELRVMYHAQNDATEKGRRKQDFITRKVFKQFDGYIYKNVGKRSHFITSYDFEDWKSIIQTAVWSGFVKTDGQAIVLYDILNSVQSVISQEVQTLTAIKRGYFQETAVDFLEDVAVHEAVNYTSYWLDNMEVKRILEGMPEKKRVVIEYYLEGYPVLSNKWNEPQVGPCIKKFTGMQDCTLYNWINEFIDIAQKEMNVPKELTGQSLSGVAYHKEKETGKKRKYPIIVDDEGNEMFTTSYYRMKQERSKELQ
jgi:hypothetical protein